MNNLRSFKASTSNTSAPTTGNVQTGVPSSGNQAVVMPSLDQLFDGVQLNEPTDFESLLQSMKILIHASGNYYLARVEEAFKNNTTRMDRLETGLSKVQTILSEHNSFVLNTKIRVIIYFQSYFKDLLNSDYLGGDQWFGSQMHPSIFNVSPNQRNQGVNIGEVASLGELQSEKCL